MEKLKRCRICLVEDVSMYEVANKDLQKTYEKLTDIPFVTEDLRPMLACFFCYTKLKQSCLFQRKCLKAEQVFSQMLNGGYEQIPLEFQGDIEFYGGFIKTPIEYMSVDDFCQAESDAITELPAVCDLKVDIEIKQEMQEYVSNEVKVEYPEDSYLYQENIPSHHSESDSEDDVPLMKIKTELEEEQEVPEESTRAPVAEKSKLEDTITNKEKGLSHSKIIHTTRIKTSKSVNKFREPVTSCTIAKPKVNTSILKKDKEVVEVSLNKEYVTEVINTTTVSNNSNQDHFGCTIFNDKGINSDNINMHKKTCKIYTCHICQRNFNAKSHLNRHIRTHTGEKPYKCEICQRSFAVKYNLKLHIRTHTGENPYKCTICQRSFNTKNRLNRHIRIHTGEKPYKCDICQRSFLEKHNLKSHIRTHTGEKPYKCTICQRSFVKKSHLNGHTRIHTGEKPYECDICQRCFTQKEYLKSHIRTHTGDKPYKCNICQHSYYRKNSLKNHILRHTGKKVYKCEICQRGFYRKDHLRNHILRHTGEKIYKCEICQRSFNQQCNLNKHNCILAGEKPYKCDRICQRSFAKKYLLNRHVRVHTGEKPYKCDICQRSYTIKATLHKHFRTHC